MNSKEIVLASTEIARVKYDKKMVQGINCYFYKKLSWIYLKNNNYLDIKIILYVEVLLLTEVIWTD